MSFGFHRGLSESLRKYVLRKYLSLLESKRGRGTELISLYIPGGKHVGEIMGMLRQEYSTAQNIKSRTTRKNVLAALRKVMSKLKLYKQIPENGLIIFCGAVLDGRSPDSTTMEIYAIEPPKPMDIYLYRCDSRFHVEPLKRLLEVREVYGVLLVEVEEATFAVAEGPRVEIVKEITSGIPGKHRAGGQSARRFERLREMEINEYFKRVGRYANDIFLSIENFKGLIVGGPGPTKDEFLKGDYLDYRLKQKVIAVVDTSYSGWEGVKEALERAKDKLKKLRYHEERSLVQKFLSHLGKDTGLAVYGESEVRRMLEMGAVEVLLISEGLDLLRVKMACKECGAEKVVLAKKGELEQLKARIHEIPCDKCGKKGLQIIDEKELIEEFIELGEKAGARVEIISTETEEGNMLLKSFGGLAGILRFRPPTLL